MTTPNEVRGPAMTAFYCGSCGRHKDESLKRKRKAGKTPICVTCYEKQAKAMARKDTVYFKGNSGRAINGENRATAQKRRAQKQYLSGKAWFPE
jgi:NAD-dependent SIR2 family protein deacetylase